MKNIEVRPWVRHWARHIDTFVYAFLSGLISGFLYALDTDNPILGMIFGFTLLGTVFLGLWIPIEAFLLSTIGTTPGKWLLCIKVRNADGSLLSFKQAATRALKIWLRGEGLRIPLVSFLTYINAYNTLNSNKVTSWDREGPFQVTHEKIGFIRGIIAIIIIFASLLLAASQQ